MVNKENYQKHTLLFTQEEIREIEKTVAEVEKKTSGEIVNLVVPSSDPYLKMRWMGGLLGWSVSSLTLLITGIKTHWDPTLWTVLECQFLAVVCGFIAGYFPPIVRFFSTSQVLAKNVHRECLAHFTALGLHHTQHHTGILIYISLLERRVEILADKGIHTKVENSFWNAHVQKIISGLKTRQTATALCESICLIGETLALHFPPDLENKNELSNNIIFGDKNTPQ